MITGLPGTVVKRQPWIDPVEVADRLRSKGGLVFLDSAMGHDKLGRYSYVAVSPFATLRVSQGIAYWNNEAITVDPLLFTREVLERYKIDNLPGLPPFQGGAIGYFSYEFGRAIEPLPFAKQPDHGAIDDVELMFYDSVCAFDHAGRNFWIISTGFPHQAPEARAYRALERARELLAAIAKPIPRDASLRLQAVERTQWNSNFTPQGYAGAVRAVVDSILAGEIFQANISQCFSAAIPKNYDSWAFYQHLRQVNAAPFCAFIERGNIAIASSSPERFLKVENRHVETRPIKGTARRAADAQEDRAIAEALLSSEKDRAENLMIVDLLRNDLSRTCRAGTVTTPQLCALETYHGVHHLVSTVIGHLQHDKTAIDLLLGAFPGGSITGAPKIKAMEIISRIEQQPRGIYCGAIGYFSFNGHADSNIAIRTVLLRPGIATFQVGGGVTALSDPDAEYHETLTKAELIFRAFETAQVG